MINLKMAKKSKQNLSIVILALLIMAGWSSGALRAAAVTSIKDIKTTPVVDCDEKVKSSEEKIKQLNDELKVLNEEKGALVGRKPVPPANPTGESKQQYSRDMQNWQMQMDQLADRIVKKSQELNYAHNQLAAAKSEAADCRSRRR